MLMERTEKIKAIGLNLIGASDELIRYAKEVQKGAGSVAFGMYKGDIDMNTAEKIEINLKEVKWRVEYIEKLLTRLKEESGLETVEQMKVEM